eukprot:SAG11_NODE_2959_length_2809_cov_3.641328_5_plen_123_part_00
MSRGDHCEQRCAPCSHTLAKEHCRLVAHDLWPASARTHDLFQTVRNGLSQVARTQVLSALITFRISFSLIVFPLKSVAASRSLNYTRLRQFSAIRAASMNCAPPSGAKAAHLLVPEMCQLLL